MDFSLTDDQELLRDTAHKLLDRECPPALVRAHIDDPAAYEPLWRHLSEYTALGTGECADACLFLKTTSGLEFNFLSDLCGFDRGPEEEPRFEVNYHLFSTTKFHRVRLKVLVNEDDAHVPSVTGVWRTANWHERETYDLFGVIFDNHPDLRRILLPDDWQGYALRKDFPLRGYEPYSLE